ncbi:hypothetical protein AB0M46_44015 [Dactylosporangium sp. NPDC051485]|uniref:hypothetical protein n=1 Tax=Dactylosporangium sp. NPDC051485 TaxID=3154846 RepID=UPI003449BF48
MNDQSIDQDVDLRVVREFSQARTRISAQPLTVIRQSVLAATVRRTGNPAPRTRLAPRWTIPHAAAAVALAVVAGAGLVAVWRGSAPQVAAPDKPSSVLVYGQQLDVPAVFAEMERAAARATPIVLPPGALIYQRIDASLSLGGPGEPLQAELHEVWFDPQGMITVKERRDGTDDAGPKGETQAELTADQRDSFAKNGPGFVYPTPAWLTGLPTDPDALLAQIRASAPPAWSADDAMLLATYIDLLSKLDLLLSPAHRIALYRLIARIGGLTANEATVDGLRLYAVRHSDLNQGKELLLDPQSGRLVGLVELSLNRFAPTPRPGASQQPAPVDPVPTINRQELWQFSTTTLSPATPN